MKQFFKFLFASCLGTILASVLLSLVSFLVISQVMANAEKPDKVKPNSVLHLTFSDEIPEKTNNAEINFQELDSKDVLGLQDYVEMIDYAAEDDNVAGIFIDSKYFPGGFATAASIRRSLSSFKESGKFVVAFADYYSQGGYHMASVADEVYMYPLGMIELKGLTYFVPFFKNMFEKLGITWQVYYAGKFKGATEPFRRDDLSKENRQQIKEYVGTWYGSYLKDISSDRNLSVDRLNEIVNNLESQNAESAISLGLIDKIGYRDEVEAALKDRLGLEKDDDINLLQPHKYNKVVSKELMSKSRDRIAVVYAEGEIVSGKGEAGTVADEQYTKIFQKIRDKKKVKALVLRVNSPGGSGMASESILREINLCKEQGLPVIVSMGNFAASGGYYIACQADSIFAEENTLTGSIGVFGMLPNMEGLLEDKMGIYFDTVKTGPNADGFHTLYPMNEAKNKYLQDQTNAFYRHFLSIVSTGRGMEVAEVDSIAQGRVWTGAKAVELGLVDQVGDMKTALEAAAFKAGLESYRLDEYPKSPDRLTQIINSVTGNDVSLSEKWLKKNAGVFYPYVKQFKDLNRISGVQARLPVFFTPGY